MVVSKKRTASTSSTATTVAPERPAKRAAKGDFKSIFASTSDTKSERLPACLPARNHSLSYHRPDLLERPEVTRSLLEWFEAVSSKREMPWRLEWIDPTGFKSKEELRDALKKRAYQVWISEIMLQQTRVETVKSYWLNWMSKWPTMEALASADPDDVLAAWRGLGYYSRATRIHTAAKKVVSDPTMQGLLPEMPDQLEKEVPGVGPYTAGAISSIVFGHAVPILDGNVARVLSRQTALYANPKAKATIDFLWAAAGALVESAAKGAASAKVPKTSRIPGQWNQALMELGSTVCSPTKPDCMACPIQTTCLAYKEGKYSSTRKGKVQDIEDLCSLCEPMTFEDEAEETVSLPATPAKEPGKKLRQATLPFGGGVQSKQQKPKSNGISQAATDKSIENHVKLFPMKLEKKRIRTEECIVCVIARRTNSSNSGTGNKMEFLLEQRPTPGLLASMWQFPSLTISTTGGGDSGVQELMFAGEKQVELAKRQAVSLLPDPKATTVHIKHEKALASLTHIFSHLQLVMHVHLLIVSGNPKLRSEKSASTTSSNSKNKNFGSTLDHKAPRQWASEEEVESESMGTGMRNCWTVVQQHLESMRL